MAATQKFETVIQIKAIRAAFVLNYVVFADSNSDFSPDSSTDEDIKKKKAEKKTKKEETDIEINRYSFKLVFFL